MAQKPLEHGNEAKDKASDVPHSGMLGASVQAGEHSFDLNKRAQDSQTEPSALQKDADLSDPKNSRIIQKSDSREKPEPVIDKEGHLSIPALEKLTHSSQEREATKLEAARKERERKEAEQDKLQDERRNNEVKQIINGINSKVVDAASQGKTSADIMNLGFTNHHGLDKYQQQVFDAIKARGLRPEVEESFFTGDELGTRTLTANWTSGGQAADRADSMKNNNKIFSGKSGRSATET